MAKTAKKVASVSDWSDAIAKIGEAGRQRREAENKLLAKQTRALDPKSMSNEQLLTSFVAAHRGTLSYDNAARKHYSRAEKKLRTEIMSRMKRSK